MMLTLNKQNTPTGINWLFVVVCWFTNNKISGSYQVMVSSVRMYGWITTLVGAT